MWGFFLILARRLISIQGTRKGSAISATPHIVHDTCSYLVELLYSNPPKPKTQSSKVVERTLSSIRRELQAAVSFGLTGSLKGHQL